MPDTIDARPYFEAFEDALRNMQDHEIRAVCIVALCDDDDIHNITSNWNAGPYEMAEAANVLQLDASLKFIKANRDELEEDDDEEDED